MSSLLTQVLRSDRVESFHTGYGVITDVAGQIIKAYGDPHYQTYVRSSAKPLQAMAVLRSGAYQDFQFVPEELAVICSSHSGEEIHTKMVERVFSKSGASSESLGCGIHPPIDRILLQNLASSSAFSSPYKVQWRSVAWTSLDEGAYYSLIAQLRTVLPVATPWWKIEQFWTVTSD